LYLNNPRKFSGQLIFNICVQDLGCFSRVSLYGLKNSVETEMSGLADKLYRGIDWQ